MQWTHHDKVVTSDNPRLGSHDIGRLVLSHLASMDPVDRIVLEGHLGTEAVPQVLDGHKVEYFKAWLRGHPTLLMTREIDGRPNGAVDVWFSPEAHAAWRFYVEHDTSISPPRKRAKVYETGDEATPYVILGARIRRWNASQDLPKPLVGATVSDPDGISFLNQLGKRRWKPIAQALVAEMVKDALRPVPSTTSTSRYQVVTLGEGQMIRFGTTGPVWVDAAAAVHLADLAGYPLGYPDEISHPLGGEGWSRLSEILAAGGEEQAEDRIVAEMKKTEDMSYAIFAGEIGAAELKRVFPDYRWGRGGRHGERLRDEEDARYARMLYRGHPTISAQVGDRLEVWLSSSAQARLIDSLSNPEQVIEPAIDEPVAATAEAKPLKLRKRQRKAIAKLARALSRLQEEGLELVVQGGVLKARVDDGDKGKEGLVTVFPEAPVIPSID